MNKALRAHKRDARKLQMVTQMLIRFEKGEQPHTTTSLAKAIGMVVSPHFRGILEELVARNICKKIEVDHRPNRRKFLYEPDLKVISQYYGDVWKEHRKRKKKSSKIMVNSASGQLDMFADWRE